MPFLESAEQVQKSVSFDQEMPSAEPSHTQPEAQDYTMNEGEEASSQQSQQHDHNEDGQREYVLARDRGRREPKRPAKFSDYEMSFFALCVAEVLECSEPSTYAEAMASEEKEKWLTAMREEIQSLLKNYT